MPTGIVAFIFLILGLLALIVFIWALIDLARRAFNPDYMKWVWLAIILLTYPVGAVVYLIAGRGTDFGSRVD